MSASAAPAPAVIPRNSRRLIMPPNVSSGRRERGSPPSPVEQLDVQRRLQPLDLLAQRGLRDAETGGRPAKVQLLRDRQEVAQVTQFDQLGPQHPGSISQRYEEVNFMILDI